MKKNDVEKGRAEVANGAENILKRKKRENRLEQGRHLVPFSVSASTNCRPNFPHTTDNVRILVPHFN